MLQYHRHEPCAITCYYFLERVFISFADLCSMGQYNMPICTSLCSVDKLHTAFLRFRSKSVTWSMPDSNRYGNVVDTFTSIFIHDCLNPFRIFLLMDCPALPVFSKTFTLLKHATQNYETDPWILRQNQRIKCISDIFIDKKWNYANIISSSLRVSIVQNVCIWGERIFSIKRFMNIIEKRQQWWNRRRWQEQLLEYGSQIKRNVSMDGTLDDKNVQ